ncbi:hypothetical protein H0O02_01835, partial [Candidatus Micrarchaeota archaeon]|nr:hypothetical protein [Candidatus Micrarchaeota archaeon]
MNLLIYSFLTEKNGLKAVSYAIIIFYYPIKVNKRHDVEFKPEPMKVEVDRAQG